MGKRFREDDPYYYEYKSICNAYDQFLKKWHTLQKRTLETPKRQLAWIDDIKHLIWEVDYAREKASDVTTGDDGPVSAAIAQLTGRLQQLLNDMLNERIEVVYDYWSKQWQQRLDGLGTSEGAYLKSTQVMDEMEQMYVFYREDWQDGQPIEARFFSIMQNMLAWRPTRNRLHYGWGLNQKFAFMSHDYDGKMMQPLLATIERETGFRLRYSFRNVQEEKYFDHAHEVDSFQNKWDYSWVFATKERRDTIYQMLLPFFEREDMRQHLLNEDGDDYFRLVTFDVYPCECGSCRNFTRSIDETFHAEQTDGWFVCFYPYTEETTMPIDASFLGDEEDYEDPIDSSGGLWYIQLRRALRAQGKVAPRGAYANHWQK